MFVESDAYLDLTTIPNRLQSNLAIQITGDMAHFYDRTDNGSLRIALGRGKQPRSFDE